VDVAIRAEELTGAPTRNFLLRNRPQLAVARDLPWNKAAFVIGWELQSQVATVAFITLVALFSIWLALAVMLTWSIIATVAYCRARERGYPSMLSENQAGKGNRIHSRIKGAFFSFFKAWLAGFQAFAFSRVAKYALVLERPCPKRRALQVLVLGVGLTLFGVTTAEHLLRKAGYSGQQLVRLGLVGPFLNVPYRILLSAGMVKFASSLIGYL
jgi:hypothetical protein